MNQLPNFLKWTGQAAAWIEGIQRAVDVAFMAGYRGGNMVALTRGAMVLPPQVVVIALSRSHETEIEGAAGRIGEHRLTLIGMLNHPTLPDFDVQRGDRFSIGAARYEVMLVNASLDGRIEAQAVGME